MLKINLTLDGNKLNLSEIINRIVLIRTNPALALHRFEIVTVPERENLLELITIIEFNLRNRAEVNSVFDENKKLIILSEILGHDIGLTEETKTKITRGEVLPVTTLALKCSDELDKSLVYGHVTQTFKGTEIPYLKLEKIEMVKPWETWSDLLKRLSVETRESVFLNNINEMSEYDCRVFVEEIETDEQRINVFKNKITPKVLKEFIEYMINKPSFKQQNLIQLINSMHSVNTLSTEIFVESEK